MLCLDTPFPDDTAPREFAPGLFLRGFAPPLVLADFKLAAFDMDSTLISIECIDEIADAIGKKAEVAAITEAAMRGEITDFRESLARRLALLAGTPESALQAVFDTRLRINPGVEAFIDACRSAGLKTLLVSGGFTFFSDRVRARLGIDFARANVLEVDGGRLTGRLVEQPWGSVVDGAEKRRLLLEVCDLMGVSPRQAIAVGDGANDLPMMMAAGLSVAYHAKPAVRERAMVSITHGGMDRALAVFTEPQKDVAMTSSLSRHVIPGSDRQPLAGARATGPVHPDERIEVTLRLRPKTPLPPAGGAQLPAHAVLSREEYAERHGAATADLATVADFAKAAGLAVVQSDAARCSVVLSGPAAAMNAAFGVDLQHYTHDGGSYRGRTGTVSVPQALGAVVEGVFGLDDRPAANPHFQIRPPVEGLAAAAASFTPTALAKLYDFPTGVDGSGQCIAIIELGGGYKPADLTTYFTALGLSTPTVKAISVDHGKNAPTNANSADGEVMLDIEVAGAIAPNAVLAVYFAPNTNQGFLDAITTAVHDAVNKPSVISISWGAAEANWTAQAMTQFDQAFQAAAAMGVTVCAAAGDNGSADGEKDGKPHVDFPASSPNVLGCGGTQLVAAAGKISAETVWNEATDNATGGGVSNFFALPDYQKNAKVPKPAGKTGGRGVPDVAGDADPQTGYQVRVDGKNLVIGGTSAVAPLWAGLVALLNQKLGHPVGFLNPLLYGRLATAGVCRDITSGSNGSFSAAPGWDACTGWGSPDGQRLAQALASPAS